MNQIIQKIRVGVEEGDLKTTNEGLNELMKTQGKKVDLFQTGEDALNFLLGIRQK